VNFQKKQSFLYYQINAQFLYSSAICMVHYDPQHASSSTLLILRRTNCITTASGIVTLCKQPFSMQVESGLSPLSIGILYGHLTDDTRGCSDAICPPEDEQGAAQNMLRIVMYHKYCWRIKELCIKLVIWKSLYCDAWLEIHQIKQSSVGLVIMRTMGRNLLSRCYVFTWQG